MQQNSRAVKEVSVDLYFTPRAENGSPSHEEILVGEINPGEPFGISALIEPHLLTAAELRR